MGQRWASLASSGSGEGGGGAAAPIPRGQLPQNVEQPQVENGLIRRNICYNNNNF